MTKQTRIVGRNPFNKNKSHSAAKEVRVERIQTAPSVQQLKPKIADWLFVHIPAKTYLFGLRTMLFAKDIFEAKV
jgi:hypothetical protein